MPLSEEELRLLEQMERALVADDPKLASTMRGSKMRHHARRRAYVAGGVFLVGVVVLMTGAVTSQTVVGIVGFVVMLGAAYVALVSWRGSTSAPAGESSQEDPHAPFTLIEGGRPSKRGGKSGGRPSQQGSLMERFEERWRRRRDQNGF
ncbi:MAG: DUF3040 domain-containing protein [Nocardioides sp.]